MRSDEPCRPWRLRAAAGVVIALLTGGVGLAQSQPPAPADAAHPASPEAAHRRLAQRLTIEVHGQRLEDVVRFLEQATGVTMEPAWRENPRDAGLDPDALVTASASNEPALSFLERVLDRADDQFDPATWQLSPQGALQFGPRSILNRAKRTEVYDIHDLLLTVPDFDEQVELDLESVLAQGDGGQGSILEETNSPQGQRPGPTDRGEEIAEILTTLIEPAQWTANGGDAASVRVYNGTLIVQAPGYIHRQISGW